MREEVIALLKSFGVKLDNEPLLQHVMATVEEQIKNETNRREVPEELSQLAVEMAVGQYLSLQKSSGQLADFDLAAAVKQIQVGDTNTVFATGEGSLTPEQRLDWLINQLINGRRQELIRFRRLQW